MAKTDGAGRDPLGSDHDGDDGDGAPGRGSYHVDIGGDASGTVIAGNHNLVIDAHGSTVNVLPPQERPRPVRRERVALLPRRQREPVGREAELGELAQALRVHGLVELWGPSGVGKSTLLRHAAHSIEPGPDGVLFLNAAHREVEDLAQEVFEACYEAPGYAPTGPELRRLMAGVRVTVYVDDAELTPEQLRLLMDAAPDAGFVLAGRERALLGEGGALELRGLDRAAGLRLLERALGQQLPPGERTAAGELCALSLGRPLLLLRAAGLAGFDEAGAPVLPRPADVQGLVPLLLDGLDAAAVRALGLLATLRDAELAPAHLGTLCGIPEPAALGDRLAGLGLVQVTGRGYRSVPDVVPEVRRREPEEFPADRLCDHFTRWVALPETTPAQVADHGRALEVAARLAERQGRPDLAVALARAVSPYLAQSLRFGVWGRLLDRGQRAARQAGDAPARAYFTHEKAIRCLLIGRRVVAAVLLAEAVLLWRQLGDTQGVDAALNAQQYTPPPTAPAPDAGPPVGDVGPGGGAPAPGDGPGGPAPEAGPGPAGDPGPAPGATGPEPCPDPTPGADSGASPGTSPGGDAWAQPGADPGAAATPAPAGPPPGADAGTVPGADPGTASASQASAPPGPEPGWFPGPDAGAATTTVPADPVTPFMAGSPAAATAGGAAAGGGTAAGAGALWPVLIPTVIGALVAIGAGVGIHQQMSSDDTPAASESGPADELAGVWSDGQGNTFRIVEAGDGSYEVPVQGTCGDSTTMEITGGPGTYSATMPVWDETSCGTKLGDADLTIRVASDWASADVRMTERSDGSWECHTCGPQSWTRLR
ncbi:AAA family ATPase [Streptomyces carpaticus]|uniref:AAA family ATPase n=1 Tax=Streptomyces carpaticus TaxID=285558 RepID=A0ABV4ZN63_9ACTN